tara:strand:+ start:2456 stop:3037 length:582 start_codon:yes stop_codon:yes gene_type:complete
MPDSTKNFSVDTVNAPVGNTTVTRTEFIDSLEHLNYASGNMRSIDELSGTAGFVQLDGSGAATIKRFLSSSGLGWTNYDGEGGNPTIRLANPVTFLQSLLSVETNTITNDYVVSIFTGVGGTFTLPEPTVGVCGLKICLNKSASNANVSITSTHWEDYPFDQSLTLSSGNFAIFAHDTSSKWYIPSAEGSTLT